MGKRILWLINNTALRQFEAPQLQAAGYEIYMPKIVPFGCGNEDASVCWDYDDSLSLPGEVLAQLNRINFYEELSSETAALLNCYFELAFVEYMPVQLRELTELFEGTLVLRALGLPGGRSYAARIAEDLSYGFLSKLERMRDRFWFAPAFKWLVKRECHFFQSRAVWLPMGLRFPSEVCRRDPSIPSVYCVCPQIKLSGQAGDAYRALKSGLEKSSRLIYGAQYLPVEQDSTVEGAISTEEYIKNLTSLYCMFFPAIQSHGFSRVPLDAIACGMPVVFTPGTFLDELSVEEDLPGKVPTEVLAWKELKRLCRANVATLNTLAAKQRAFLKPFDWDNCVCKWQESFARIQACLGQTDTKAKRLAVILPQPYTGGVLDYTCRLLRAIQMGAKECGDKLELIFGYIDHPVFTNPEHFKPIKKLGIALRAFTWKTTDHCWAQQASRMRGFPEYPTSERYSAMEDGMAGFEDCDYLIFVADRVADTYYGTKPYAVVAHDYIQRYVPELLSKELEAGFYFFERQSDAIFVTSPPNYVDALQCGGNCKDRIFMTPMIFDLIPMVRDNQTLLQSKYERPYFIWGTDQSLHKNHILALRALASYYGKGGTIQCLMTGGNTKWLDPRQKPPTPSHPYFDEVRALIKQETKLQRNLRILGELPKDEYFPLLANAKYIFHPGYADNGNGTALDAASLGVPALSSDYPAMRYMDTLGNLNLHFFDPFDVDDIVRALFEAEDHYEAYKKLVPGRDVLKKFSVESTYREIYQVIRRVAMIGK